MAPFYGWGSTASRLEPLREGSLLFATKFPGRMKGWVDLGATQWFWPQDPNTINAFQKIISKQCKPNKIWVD